MLQADILVHGQERYNHWQVSRRPQLLSDPVHSNVEIVITEAFVVLADATDAAIEAIHVHAIWGDKVGSDSAHATFSSVSVH